MSCIVVGTSTSRTIVASRAIATASPIPSSLTCGTPVPAKIAKTATMISAALTALGGGIYAQYMMYINPETLSGIAVSLQIVFAAIAGGMYAMLGPSVGALLTIALTEGLRVWFGTNFIGAANTIYGILLILFIIFMPRGIMGVIESLRAPPRRAPTPAPAE